MRLSALCLFAVCCCCCSLVNAAATAAAAKTDQGRKLQEVLRQLSDVKDSVQFNEKMLSSPPENIEDCCCLSALECFRANMQVHLNVTGRKLHKLLRSLKNPLTLSGLDSCKSGNDTVRGNLTCHDCDSHPKVNVQEFFNRLESLIQRVRISSLILSCS
uniref:Interleukin n=1 Tax=Scophthalmus maximus TaxID=52904 RepID=A0A8D3A5Q8_SCOMX